MGRHPMLRHETRCTYLKGLFFNLRIVGTGEDDNSYFGYQSLDLAADLNSVDVRHGDVDDNELGLQFEGGLDKSGSSGHTIEDLVRRGQEPAHGRQDPDMIIG